MKFRQRLVIVSALAAAVFLPLQISHAQTYPNKPVKLITPFPVGSGPEGILRLVADKLSKKWGQPVLVENKPGGNGFIAIEQLKRAPTDGYELIQLDNVHLTAYPHLFKKLPYDAKKDFEPITPLFKAFFFVTTATDSKYKRFADIIADAKANPGKLNYGSWSVGNPVHLGSARLEVATGTDMQHVIYKETSQLYTSVATGELSFALGSSGTSGPLYRAGRLKYLAIAAPQRLAAFPDVPTLAESGGPANFEVSGWTTIAAPAGTPKAVVDKLQKDIESVLAEQEIKDKYVSFGYVPFNVTRDQFAKYIQTESMSFADVIAKTKSALD